MTALTEPAVAAPPTTRRARLRVLRHPKIVAGLAILGFFAFLAVSQPVLDATVWRGQSFIYDPQFGFDSSVTHPSAPSAALSRATPIARYVVPMKSSSRVHKR